MGLRINVFKKTVKLAGYKLKDFAPLLGYKDVGGLNSAFARDNMSMDKVYKAAEILGVKPEEIYDFEGEKPLQLQEPTTETNPQNLRDMDNQTFNRILDFLEKQIEEKDRQIRELIGKIPDTSNQSTGTNG